ncbi:hypothetical protein KR054_004410 [Drosophila jambulina]|nr:hypothetical protein KR054_004410 [Drosophila jambulina]
MYVQRLKMTEPSEAWLDWHFNTQLLTYMEEDLPAACLSDRVIMAKWLLVFRAAPASQKMARNSLMLLMHGHLEDFGFLRTPFTDVNNCNRDLNQVINGYHGISLLKPLKNRKFKGNDLEKMGPQRVAGGRAAYRSRSLKRIPKLDPITEVSEPSSAYSSEVFERNIPRSPLAPAGTYVRQRVQAIEKELARNRPSRLRKYSTPRRGTQQSCRNNVKTSSSFRDINRVYHDPHCPERKPEIGSPTAVGQLTPPMQVRSTQNIENYHNAADASSPNQDRHSQRMKLRSGSPTAVRKLTPPLQVRSTQNLRKCTQSYCNDTVTSSPNRVFHSHRWKPDNCCTSVVQNLKDCFQEVSERLKDPTKNDKPVLGRIRATAPSPVSPKRASHRYKSSSEDVLISKTRHEGGQSFPICYQRDRTVMDLLRRQAELRRQCLEYYNLDGTLKDDEELPAPTSVPESKLEGFYVGACRAMGRIRKWRGKPNQLKFFRTFFREIGLESDITGKVKGLDRRFEQVALQWLRSKRRRYPSGSNVGQEPRSLKELLEKQKAAKTEYMAHVAKIGKLCETHCRGVVPTDVLEKMFRCLDREYKAAKGVVQGLERYLEDA